MKYSTHPSKPDVAVTSALSQSEKILRETMRLAELKQFDPALALLNRANVNSDAIRNARGVCLMRMGRHDDALQLYRGLVLSPGSTWMKRDLPVVYCTNFCTVLLLTGHPVGCFDALSEITDNAHPSVVRLYATLQRWQKGLPIWPRLIWKMGADPNVPVPIDFIPGEFVDPLTAPNMPPQRDPSKEAA